MKLSNNRHLLYLLFSLILLCGDYRPLPFRIYWEDEIRRELRAWPLKPVSGRRQVIGIC